MPSSEPRRRRMSSKTRSASAGATGALERSHQHAGHRFLQRVLGEQRAEVSDHVGRTTLREAGLGQRASGQEVASLEPLHLDIDEDLVEVGERSTPVQAKRPFDSASLTCGSDRQCLPCSIDELVGHM